ncbi:MAG: class I SAM-dependent methyltransferase [Candidatus Omnitrophica bacterium]|nr:class I SAM-dependent methyltransferase [Candidatus Omnitrophota bacterium]
MSKKAYREYYERLALAREKLRAELAQKAKTRSFWSINYKASFKGTFYEMISRRLSGQKRPLVLDMGCGRGGDFSYLSKARSFDGYGIDLSYTRLKVALSNDSLDKFGFIQADALNVPFKDAAFDMAICSELIEHLHLADAETCVQEIKRVLKEKGILFLSTPNRWDYFHLIGQIIPRPLRRRLAKTLRGEEVDIDPSEFVTQEGMKEHVHLFTIKEIEAFLERLGFSIEEIKVGKLTVPIPRFFDRFVVLQKIWIAFDKVIGLLPLPLCIKATILIVCRKKK